MFKQRFYMNAHCFKHTTTPDPSTEYYWADDPRYSPPSDPLAIFDLYAVANTLLGSECMLLSVCIIDLASGLFLTWMVCVFVPPRYLVC